MTTIPLLGGLLPGVTVTVKRMALPTGTDAGLAPPIPEGLIGSPLVVHRFRGEALYRLDRKPDAIAPLQIYARYAKDELEYPQAVEWLKELDPAASLGLVGRSSEGKAVGIGNETHGVVGAGTDQQAAVAAIQGEDGYNWGYDPVHYMTPEGSYAIHPDQRVQEGQARNPAAPGRGMIAQAPRQEHPHGAPSVPLRQFAVIAAAGRSVRAPRTPEG